MGLAYVKISQISGLKIDKGARYELSATLSSDNSIVQPVLFEIKNNDGNSCLVSDNIWMLPYEITAKDDSISLTLVEGKKKYNKVAKLILPLKWFPPDVVVHENYPMHHFEENENKKRKIFADILIHLSTKGADPFRAPPGQLLVRPMWVNTNVPQQSAVGYIPGQCRPPQFMQPLYNQYAYNQPVQPIIKPPIGIPQIRGGPAPQVFTQPFAPPPYQFYMNIPQQPQPQLPPQLPPNQVQLNQPQFLPPQSQTNQPPQAQFNQQFQPQNQPNQSHQTTYNQTQVPQQKIITDRETSSSDDDFANISGNTNHTSDANTNQPIPNNNEQPYNSNIPQMHQPLL